MDEELRKFIEQLGLSFEQFKSEHNARVDEIEKRMNRPRAFDAGTGAGSGDADLVRKQRPALEAGVKALIAGNEAEASRHFAEIRAMSVGSDPDGGYFAPIELQSSMTRVMLETAPFIGLPRTVELKYGDRFEEVVDKESADASWVGETSARDDTSTPGLGMFEAPLHEIYAQPKLTQKLIDTSNIDVVAWLSDKVGEQFGNKEVDAFLNGDGVIRPRGFLTLPTAATADATRAWGTLEHVVTGANGAFKAAGSDPADCLIDLVAKLKKQYRAGAVWLMNRTAEAMVRKIKDSQGRFILVDSLIAGQPNQLLGYPVVETEQMPDPATGSLSIAFGNFKKAYTIVRRQGVKMLSDPYTDKPNVKLYTYKRVGGGVNNSEAIKLLKFST